MNFAQYFVDRPIFASVLSVFVFIAGFIAMLNLPVLRGGLRMLEEVFMPQIEIFWVRIELLVLL